MNKKLLSASLVSVFAVGALAGCGGSNFEVILPDVKVLTFDEIKDKEIEIDFWHSFGSAPTAALEEQVKAFMAKYPKITVNLTSKGGYDNLKKAVSLEIPTTNTPDVVLGYPDHFAEYLAGGIMVPLDDYMESTDKEIGVIEGSTNVKNDYYENYMTENKQYYKDLTFGLPFNKSTELMFYNKTFFDAHELTVPATWDEVKTTSKKIYGIVKGVLNSGNTIDPKSKLNFKDVKIDDVYPFAYDSAANAFITLTRQFGGEYTQVGDNFEEGTIKFDNAGTKEALNFIKGMSDEHTFAVPDTWEAKYTSDALKALKTFMCIGSSAGSYHNAWDSKSETGEWKTGIAPLPYKDAKSKAVIQQGTNIAMLSNNTDEERMASWLLIRFLTSYVEVGTNADTNVDPNAAFAYASSYLPVRASGTDGFYYKDCMDTTGVANAKDLIIADAAKKATAYDNTWTKFTDPAFIGSSEVRNIAGQIIPSLIVAKKSVDEVIKEAYDQLPSYQ